MPLTALTGPFWRSVDARDAPVKRGWRGSHGTYTIARIRGMRVTVDTVLCEANAVCAGLVPEIFSVNDLDELSIVAGDVPPELADRVREAVRCCPKMALLLEE